MKKNNLYVIMFLISFFVPTIKAITFYQGINQVWGLSVQNKTDIPLAIVDEIFYPTHTKIRKEVINPGTFYRSKWVTAALGRDYKSQQSRNFDWVLTSEPPLGRTLTIWGACRGGSEELTNVIVIGNVNYATYQQPPSGTYTIIHPRGTPSCTIGIAKQFDTKYAQ